MQSNQIRMLLSLPSPDLLMLGVGYHHAGLDLSDRKLIEKAFMLADLPVLCEILYDNISGTMSEYRFNFICIRMHIYYFIQFYFFLYFFCTMANRNVSLDSCILTLLLIVVSQ